VIVQRKATVVENAAPSNFMVDLEKDIAACAILVFDFLVAAPAGRYPLWTVHSALLLTGLRLAVAVGVVSAIGLPVWLGVRLVRESRRRGLKVVELVGALYWLVFLGHLILSEFPVI
jgi:hypothetical protein